MYNNNKLITPCDVKTDAGVEGKGMLHSSTSALAHTRRSQLGNGWAGMSTQWRTRLLLDKQHVLCSMYLLPDLSGIYKAVLAAPPPPPQHGGCHLVPALTAWHLA